jgi:hypothetical protein
MNEFVGTLSFCSPSYYLAISRGENYSYCQWDDTVGFFFTLLAFSMKPKCNSSRRIKLPWDRYSSAQEAKSHHMLSWLQQGSWADVRAEAIPYLMPLRAAISSKDTELALRLFCGKHVRDFDLCFICGLCP